MKKFLLLVSIAAVLSACANQTTNDRNALMAQNWTNDRLYQEAREELNSGNYTRAIALYELLRARSPDGRFTEQSLLETAYAHYKDEEPDKALSALSRFEQHFPGSANMDYAIYLRGLILFDEDQSFVNKLANQDWSDRDSEKNRRAYYAFETLLKRFPESKYADDARARMAKLVDGLGGHEISIARYYAKRGAYVAAANRAQSVIRQFQNTRYLEEALAIMEYSYQKMGNEQLAQDTRRVLQQNFPESPYLKKTWAAQEMPWWRYWQ